MHGQLIFQKLVVSMVKNFQETTCSDLVTAYTQMNEGTLS